MLINNPGKLIIATILTLFTNSALGQTPNYDVNYMLNNSEFYLGSIIINSTYPNISYQITKNGYQLFSNNKLKTANNPLGKNILAELTLTGPHGAGISYEDAKLSTDRLLDDKGTLKLAQSDNTGINLMGMQLQYAGPASSANNIIVQSIGDPSLMASATLFVYSFLQNLTQFAPVITQSSVINQQNNKPITVPKSFFFINLYFDPAIGEVHIDSIDAYVYVATTAEQLKSYQQAGGGNAGFAYAVAGFIPQLIHIDKQALMNNNIIVEQGE